MEPKTPVLKDKRLWFSVATIISLVASQFAGINLDPELLVSIALIVVGYITNSAVKEAVVSKAQIASDGASERVRTEAEAAAVLRGGAQHMPPAL